MGLSDAKTQIIVVGLIALTCPGLFNALNGLGAAGGSNPEYANKANTALYACFAVLGYFGGAFFNLFGNRILLCLGGSTYCLYALGMYLSSNVNGAGWVSILAGIILGIGAGLFWTAQGAMMMAYSTPFNKGKYIGLFWILFNLGGVAGGLIQFGINFHDTIDQANPASYFTFVGLMALGAICVPFLIVPPQKVKKEDGSQVAFSKATDPMQEIKGALKVATNKYMILLTVYFIASNWFYTYQFNFVNGSLFTIRTRGLNSALYWAAQMLAAYLIGIVMDLKGHTKRQRAVYGFMFSTIAFTIAWSFGVWLQYGFEDGYDKNWALADQGELIDFTDSRRCALPSIIYCLYGFADAGIQAFAYWIMGAVAGNDTFQAARFAGYYKGVQSAGAAVAWGVDLSDNVSYASQFWTGFGLWALGTILAWFAVRDVRNAASDEPILQASLSVLNNTGEGAAQYAAGKSVERRSKSGSMSMATGAAHVGSSSSPKNSGNLRTGITPPLAGTPPRTTPPHVAHPL